MAASLALMVAALKIYRRMLALRVAAFAHMVAGFALRVAGLGRTVASWKFEGGLKISEAPSKILGARPWPTWCGPWGAEKF